MAFQQMFTILSILTFSLFASAAPTNCNAAVRVISVRGTDEVFGHSVLQDVFTAVLESGVKAVLQGTPYPAIMDNSDWSVYGGSVQAGVDSLQGIIKSAVAQCPDQKIVLIGYSQVSMTCSVLEFYRLDANVLHAGRKRHWRCNLQRDGHVRSSLVFLIRQQQ